MSNVGSKPTWANMATLSFKKQNPKQWKTAHAMEISDCTHSKDEESHEALFNIVSQYEMYFQL